MKKKKTIIILIIVIAIALIGIGLYLIFGKKKTPDGPTISYNDLVNFNNDTNDPNAWVPPDIDRNLKFDDYAMYTPRTDVDDKLVSAWQLNGFYVSHVDEELNEMHVIFFNGNPNLFSEITDNALIGRFTNDCIIYWDGQMYDSLEDAFGPVLNRLGFKQYLECRSNITPDMYQNYSDQMSGYDYEVRNNQSYIWEDNLTESDEYYDWFAETWGYDIRDKAQDWNELSDEEKSEYSYQMNATAVGNYRVVCDTTLDSEDYIAQVMAVYNVETNECSGDIFITCKRCDELNINLRYEDVTFPEYLIQYAQGIIDSSLQYYVFDNDTKERKD